MIHFTQGNLLESEAEALVNTVNTVGVMGKGIALQFKEHYPENYRVYRSAHKAGELSIGKLLVVEDLNAFGKKTIINFPTKKHWRTPSTYEYIEEGLKALVDWLSDAKVKSIAIPPLGCGNGGLDWGKVKDMIESYLKDSPVEIFIYEPNPDIKQQIQAKAISKSVKLTPARAMLLYALFQYEKQGEGVSLFVANKLAYFLQRLGEKLKLKFTPHFYGPYTPQVKHVLYYLNGVYLKGLEQQSVKPFEELYLNYERYAEVDQFVHEELDQEQKHRLDSLIDLIKGYESAYSLEILSSVDYIQNNYEVSTDAAIIEQAAKWSKRKETLLKPVHVEKARNQLEEYASKVDF